MDLTGRAVGVTIVRAGVSGGRIVPGGRVQKMPPESEEGRPRHARYNRFIFVYVVESRSGAVV